MARTIHEWAESGVGSEVRALYMAGPGRKSNEDDDADDQDNRSGAGEGGMGEGRTGRRHDMDDDGMESEGGARE